MVEFCIKTMNFVLQMMNFVSDAVGKWAHKIGLELGE